MKGERSALRIGALATLVTLAGLFLSALPGHLGRGAFVVRADNCVYSGKATVVNGTQTCDCVIIGGNDCGCIAKCPNSAQEAELQN